MFLDFSNYILKYNYGIFYIFFQMGAYFVLSILQNIMVIFRILTVSTHFSSIVTSEFISSPCRYRKCLLCNYIVLRTEPAHYETQDKQRLISASQGKRLCLSWLYQPLYYNPCLSNFVLFTIFVYYTLYLIQIIKQSEISVYLQYLDLRFGLAIFSNWYYLTSIIRHQKSKV